MGSGSKSNFSKVLIGALVALLIQAGLVASAAATNTIANRELGQIDFFHNTANSVEPDVVNGPFHLAVDKSVVPNRIYVADSGNNRVLGYRSVAALVNGASAELVIGQTDFYSGSAIFGATPFTLNTPRGVAVDSKGNLFVADTNDHRVLEYNQPFTYAALHRTNAGQPADWVIGQGGSFYSFECNLVGGSGPPPSDETLCFPYAVALDKHDNLFVADYGNNRVLEYKAPFSSDFAANEVFGQQNSFFLNSPNDTPGAQGVASAVALWEPTGLAFDPQSNLWIADWGNNRVLKFPSPLTHTTASLVVGQFGDFKLNACNNGGSTSSGTLCGAYGMAFDAASNLFIADSGDNRVLEYPGPVTAKAPTAQTVFGQGGNFTTSSTPFGPPSSGTLSSPIGLSLDSAGDLFVADSRSNRVLKFVPKFSSKPVANVVIGQRDFAHGTANNTDSSSLYLPSSVAIDRSVTPNRLYVADTKNNRVLGFKNAAGFLNRGSADLVIGQPDFFGSTCQFPVSGKVLCNPNQVAVDPAGNLYVADTFNNRVLKFSRPFASGKTSNQPAIAVWGQAGNFTTTAGCSGFPPSATKSSMCNPTGVAVDAANDALYVADNSNNRVLQYFHLNASGTDATRFFGQPDATANFCRGGGGATANNLCGPIKVLVDSQSRLWVADTIDSRVLVYNNPLHSTSANKVFGQQGSLSSDDCDIDGVAPDSLCSPQAMAIDPSGNVYIADSANNRVLEYAASTFTGSPHASLVLGQGHDFGANNCNFGNPNRSTAQSMCSPTGLAVDYLGNLYVADQANNRVLEFNTPLR